MPIDMQAIATSITDRHKLYIGPLSTPPCDKGIEWILIKEPLQLSQVHWNSLKAMIKITIGRFKQPLRLNNSEQVFGVIQSPAHIQTISFSHCLLHCPQPSDHDTYTSKLI